MKKSFLGLLAAAVVAVTGMSCTATTEAAEIHTSITVESDAVQLSAWPRVRDAILGREKEEVVVVHDYRRVPPPPHRPHYRHMPPPPPRHHYNPGHDPRPHDRFNRGPAPRHPQQIKRGPVNHRPSKPAPHYNKNHKQGYRR